MKPIINCLSLSEANEYLETIGMRVGSWNEITTIDINKKFKLDSISYQAPKNTNELRVFAFHVAGWLAKGKWKMFQIDNSSNFDITETSLLNRLLFGSDNPKSLVENRSYLFKFGENNDADWNAEFLLASLIFLFLQYESYVYLVSSNCISEEFLSIHDGFVYFIGNENALSNAKSLLGEFERSTLTMPDWVIEIIIKQQELV